MPKSNGAVVLPPVRGRVTGVGATVVEVGTVLPWWPSVVVDFAVVVVTFGLVVVVTMVVEPSSLIVVVVDAVVVVGIDVVVAAVVVVASVVVVGIDVVVVASVVVVFGGHVVVVFSWQWCVSGSEAHVFESKVWLGLRIVSVTVPLDGVASLASQMSV